MKFVVPGMPKCLQRHRVSRWGGYYDPSANDKKAFATYALAHRDSILGGDLFVEAYFSSPIAGAGT